MCLLKYLYDFPETCGREIKILINSFGLTINFYLNLIYRYHCLKWFYQCHQGLGRLARTYWIIKKIKALLMCHLIDPLFPRHPTITHLIPNHHKLQIIVTNHLLMTASFFLKYTICCRLCPLTSIHWVVKSCWMGFRWGPSMESKKSASQWHCHTCWIYGPLSNHCLLCVKIVCNNTSY